MQFEAALHQVCNTPQPLHPSLRDAHANITEALRILKDPAARREVDWETWDAPSNVSSDVSSESSSDEEN